MANKKFYGMKNDYMFKAVLQKSNEVLRNLVSVLLDIDESEIVSCEIMNTIELGESVDGKDCVLDVKVELNSREIIDIELQVSDEHNWPERSLFYWSRAYNSLAEGDDYSLLKKTYHIGILDFTLFEDNPYFYSEYVLKDKVTGYEYSDKLNIRILDLTKIPEKENESCQNSKLIKWAKIFKAKTLKELEMIAGKEEVFRKMVSHVRRLSADEKIRLQCQAREDIERRMSCEYTRGKREGIELGISQGLSQGLSQGITQMVLNALNNNKTPEEIAEFNGIELKTVLEIQKEKI